MKIAGTMMILLFLCSSNLCAQQTLCIEASLAGLSRDSVGLYDIRGKALAREYMEHGKFLLQPGDIPVGLYYLHIGRKFRLPLFCGPEHCYISGYLDPDKPSDNELTVEGMAVHNRYRELYDKIKNEKKQYEDRIMANIRKAPTETEQQKWITLLNSSHTYMTGFIRGLLKDETCDELAAYIAFLFPGPYYEDSKCLYDGLSEKARASDYGQALQKILYERFRLADGQPAPGFVLEDTTGKKISLDDFRGKIVVIDFWASWCGPCRAELKSLKKIYENTRQQDVVFISVSLDDKREDWLKAAAEEQIPWVSLWEPGGFKKSAIREAYCFQTIPFIVVVDPEGNIAGKDLRRDNLTKCLEKTMTK